MSVRILCLGDDFVIGQEAVSSGFRSWRGTLYAQLVAAGRDVDFVGTLSSTPAVGGDADHNGYVGDTCSALSARVSGIGGSVGTVNGVVLHVGWADVLASTSGIGAAYTSLVQAVRSQWPGAWIVLCTLSARRDETEAETGAALPLYGTINAAIRALVGTGIYIAELATASGTSDSEWLAQVINDMVGAEPETWTAAGGAQLPMAYSALLVTSADGIRAANAAWSTSAPNAGTGASPLPVGAAGLGDGHPAFVNGMDACVPWSWFYAAPGNTASNTQLELRLGFAQALRKSTGRWEWLYRGARAWGTQWDGQTNLGGGGGQGALTGETSYIRPAGNIGYEVWPRPTDTNSSIVDFYGGINGPLVRDAAAFCMGIQYRPTLINPGGTDDRAQLRIVRKQGFDIYRTPGYVGGRQYDYLGFPLHVMDGGGGRWRVFDGSVTDWRWVTCTSCQDIAGIDAGIAPPWGFWQPSWSYNDVPAYSITRAQLEANPPLNPLADGGASYATADYFDTYRHVQSGATKSAGAIFSVIEANSLASTEPPPYEPPPATAARVGRWIGDAETGGAYKWVQVFTTAGGSTTVLQSTDDDMQQIKKDEATAARRRVYFTCVDATDGFTAETGLTFSAGELKISKNGAAEANHTGTATEVAGGAYYYEYAAAEVDTFGGLQLRTNKSGVRGVIVRAQVVAFDPYAATNLGLSNFDASVSSRLASTSYEAPSTALTASNGVETGITLQGALRSLLAGQNKRTGVGTSSETYRDSADTKNRLVVTVDGSGNVTGITRDLS